MVKLNIDGALDVTHGLLRTGAVCRDEYGTCLGVLAVPGDAALDSTLDDYSAEGALIEEAKFYISCFQSCTWSFVLRKGNMAAHAVARQAISCPFPTYWWQMVPEWLSSIIVDESRL
ncbi:hypothetical protein ACLB2K_046991 [Fragaria x ananassa]